VEVPASLYEPDSVVLGKTPSPPWRCPLKNEPGAAREVVWILRETKNTVPRQEYNGDSLVVQSAG